jgi:transposase
LVHAAHIQDRDGAMRVLARLAGRFPRVRRLRADGGYAGRLIAWARQTWGWTVAIVKRATGEEGCAVLPRRWAVERTLGWFGRYRGSSEEDEGLPRSSEAMVLIAMAQVMLRRLAPP